MNDIRTEFLSELHALKELMREDHVKNTNNR